MPAFSFLGFSSLSFVCIVVVVEKGRLNAGI
jgi:hypothetical protein